MTTVFAALLLVGGVGAVAGAKGASSGTWTFTDTTPDPTVVTNDATQHCEQQVPAGPLDVTSQPFKAKSNGVLTLTSHNALDWAMEVKDAKGNIITGTDGGSPDTPEDMTVGLTKGSYEVIYCNFSGEPQITVDYSFKKSR